MADRYGFTTIATELEDRILTVSFNRPDRLNALNKVMHDELTELYARIERDEDVDVVLLTGAGKAFCVGADFDQMEENLERGGYVRRERRGRRNHYTVDEGLHLRHPLEDHHQISHLLDALGQTDKLWQFLAVDAVITRNNQVDEGRCVESCRF